LLFQFGGLEVLFGGISPQNKPSWRWEWNFVVERIRFLMNYKQLHIIHMH